ncbi:hypothetical protein [Thermomonas sp. HDW16]|uniref:hypothetical protein n=1 Tax=Thermomonas sp. HDW16 TaxID=2714945 RepID=UPI001409A6AA|nr:hypothetical protein [Thermomonas sp. HDW16]QIL19637.1 hypothetical protein G7079_02225 [Thermomonas sp. HDW16]
MGGPQKGFRKSGYLNGSESRSYARSCAEHPNSMDFRPMNNQTIPSGFNEIAWVEAQIERYGPMVGGAALRSLLGFRTTAAFQKARLQGQLGVAVFPLLGRMGVFAVTEEACAWVLAQRQSQSTATGKAGSRLPGKGGVMT